MKKFKILLGLILIIFILSSCQKIEVKKLVPKEPTTGSGLEKSCTEAHGNWLEEYQECENAGKDWCDTHKGKFEECTSACRHDPNAELCTMQCVPVCGFGVASKPETKAVPPLLGGDRDEHGCIGSAGYQWCEAKSKCLRIWEEPCEGNAGGSDCALETCHGLNIVCGSNPPDVCTEMYGIGDKCLQYAKCGVQNGKCQQIQNSQFTQCKLCVQKCIDANENDNMKLFECESKCN